METVEIYKKYYSNIPKTVFTKICQGDPTSNFEEKKLIKVGRYVKWLTKLYLNNNLLLEDLTKAKEYLTTLYNIKNHIKGVDIFNFDSLTDGETPLYNLILKYDKPSDLNDERKLITNQYYLINKEAEVVSEDEKWFVIVPKTPEASAFYASNTQWCTRYPEQFKNYNSRGKLYIFIDKTELISDISKVNISLNKNRRLQFHLESKQFMDCSDRSVSDDMLSIVFNVLKNRCIEIYKFDLELNEFKDIYKGNFSNVDIKKIYKFLIENYKYRFCDILISYSKNINLDPYIILKELIIDKSEYDDIYCELLLIDINNNFVKDYHSYMSICYEYLHQPTSILTIKRFKFNNNLIKLLLNDDDILNTNLNYILENFSKNFSKNDRKNINWLYNLILIGILNESDILLNKFDSITKENKKCEFFIDIVNEMKIFKERDDIYERCGHMYDIPHFIYIENYVRMIINKTVENKLIIKQK